MRTINSLFVNKLGIDLEDAVVEAFINSTDVSSHRATREEDKCKGTDFFAWGVPVDVTCNMGHKDHIVMTRDYNEYWTMGVRVGNNYKGGKKFDTPVVVMGLKINDMNIIKKEIIPYLRNYINVRGMADAISDLFCDYDEMVNG